MSLEFNKIAGAGLGALVFAMGIGFVSSLIFEAHEPEKPGFEVAVTEEAAPAEGGAPAAAEVEPIAVRLASADAAAGQAVSKQCGTCHDLTSANANKVGPGLWNIVDREPGHHEGFSYSPAMVEFGKANPNWNYDHLDDFLANPKGSVPGTKMAFAGVKKPVDRANLIAFLRTLSDNPVALPSPEAAAAPAEAAPAEAAPAEAAPAEAAPAEAAPAQ
jgi:cytochrome c